MITINHPGDKAGNKWSMADLIRRLIRLRTTARLFTLVLIVIPIWDGGIVGEDSPIVCLWLSTDSAIAPDSLGKLFPSATLSALKVK